MNKGNIFFNQCMVSNHMYQDVHFKYKVLWHPEMCFSFYKTVHYLHWLQLTGIHTEHNLLPHVHDHSCICRYTVLCYTVLPLYTRRLILSRRAVLLLYTPKVTVTSGQRSKRNWKCKWQRNLHWRDILEHLVWNACITISTALFFFVWFLLVILGK